MYVIKRNGEKQPVLFDKISKRLYNLCAMEPALSIDPIVVSQKVVNGVYAGVTTRALDVLAAETAAYLSTTHPEYGTLAARISISNLHKETEDSWLPVVEQMYNYHNPKTGEAAPLLGESTYKTIKENIETFEKAIVHERDYSYDFFGFKTLERSYLARCDKKIVERPQYMLMRVAVGIHGDDIESALETYRCLSLKYFIHATPTLFNAGTPTPQMSSCFLLTMKEDSIEGIYETLKQCALISKSAGGIGLSVSCIRAQNSYIKGTNGTSNGLVPMLRVFNDTARYVDQGGGKRKGAFAVYLEPWHADVFEFLDLRKNTGKSEARARDLFYALWVPDLFMERCKQNGNWSLFCPNEAPGLQEVYGEEFNKLYEQYEREGRARKVIPAQDLWFAIIDSQIETGTPFILYKDACNEKSNQKNLGTIKSSNLCTEIIEYTAPDEVAVCNLASLALPKFVNDKPEFDHQQLYDMTYHVTRNLNRIIDRNHYPVPEALNSNLRHRPIGIGVQGLADVFLKLRFPFDSEGAKKLNREIFETIYFAALSASKDLAKRDGHYPSFPGSPASQGKLQFDLWNVRPSPRWDWDTLKAEIKKHGLRNSLLVAPMPTASTSQILGNNECTEPYTSNIYTRRVLAGEFVLVNKFLLKDLMDLGIWNEDIKNHIIADGGSVQNISEIPNDLKELYRTVWEIRHKPLVDMAADRGAFIDQSQSFNAFIANPDPQKMTSMHFYAWEKGLKTGMYYLRTRPAANAIQFTVDQKKLAERRVKQEETEIEQVGEVCMMEEGCLVCGS